MTYILIIFLATSHSAQSGAAGISQQFESKLACMQAGNSLVELATKRENYVLSWGCFPKV